MTRRLPERRAGSAGEGVLVCDVHVIRASDGTGCAVVEPLARGCSACRDGRGCGGRFLTDAPAPRVAGAIAEDGEETARVVWSSREMVATCLRVYALPMGALLLAMAAYAAPPEGLAALPGAGTDAGAAAAGACGLAVGILAARALEYRRSRRAALQPRILEPASALERTGVKES